MNNIDYIDVPDHLVMETLIAEAHLGQAAEDWLHSDIGRYVLGTANQEIKLAVEQLKTVDPDKEKAVRELQFSIAKCELAIKWILEVIDRGNDAFQSLNTEQ